MKNIFFSIITPTHKRPLELARALNSFILQNFRNSQMIIINDSPLTDYKEIEEKIKNENKNQEQEQEQDQKIIYLKNKTNLGKNFSLNLALKFLIDKDFESKQDIQKNPEYTEYIIFLDDDDWLNENALSELAQELQSNQIDWLITNRIKQKTVCLTKIKTNKNNFNYFLDYLLFKNISGDATHIIKKEIASKIKFSEKIKNGEEWLYFIQINSTLIYKNLNTTKTEGYLSGGVTELLKDKYKENTKILWQEILNNKKLFFNLKIFIYMFLRGLKNLLNLIKGIQRFFKSNIKI